MKITYEVTDNGKYCNAKITNKKNLSVLDFKKRNDGRKIGKRTYAEYPRDRNHAIEILYPSMMQELQLNQRAPIHMKVYKADEKEKIAIKIDAIEDYYNITLPNV